MSARTAVSKIVTATVAPLLEAAGFRKQAFTFERRRGDVTQLVNVQLSHGGHSFYVNVGLVFDAIAALDAENTGSIVLGGRTVHLGRRLHELVPGLAAAWDTADPEAGNLIRAGLESLVAILDRIDGPRTMLAALPLDDGFEKILRAQLRWTLGDRAGARADLEAVGREFSDRRGCTVPELARRAGIAAILASAT